jgi:cell division protein FtsW (lipid II flippase)
VLALANFINKAKEKCGLLGAATCWTALALLLTLLNKDPDIGGAQVMLLSLPYHFALSGLNSSSILKLVYSVFVALLAQCSNQRMGLNIKDQATKPFTRLLPQDLGSSSRQLSPGRAWVGGVSCNQTRPV